MKGWDSYLWKGVYKASCLWQTRISQVQIPSESKAAVDAHWVCFMPLYGVLSRRIMFITYSAWASGVARSTGKGNARAKVCGTSNQVQTLTLFSYL